MELVEGIKVTDLAALERAGIDKHQVAQKLIEIFTQQILRDGFFHADPHPGNILVQPGPRIVLLDFGLAKDFPPAFRDAIVRLTFAILTSNRDAIVMRFTTWLSHSRRLARNPADAGGPLSGQYGQAQRAYADRESDRGILR